MIQRGQRGELSKTFTADDVAAFAAASGDHNPVHLDPSYAATTRFGKPIVHGMLVAGLISAVLGTEFPGPGTIYLGQELRFQAPVFIGDTVRAVVEVTDLHARRPIATLSTQCYNQENQLVIDGEAVVMVPQENSNSAGGAA